MNKFCHDCLVKEGQLHLEECDMERCPKCNNGQQLLSCRYHTWKDLSDEEREPFFNEVFSCVRCGEIMPDIFMISNEEWLKIIGCTYKKEDMLCKKCIEFIGKKRELLKGGENNG